MRTRARLRPRPHARLIVVLGLQRMLEAVWRWRLIGQSADLARKRATLMADDAALALAR